MATWLAQGHAPEGWGSSWEELNLRVWGVKSPKHRRKSVRKFAQQDSGVSVNWPWADFAIFLSPVWREGLFSGTGEELASFCSAHS